jgi:hypothetical protein
MRSSLLAFLSLWHARLLQIILQSWRFGCVPVFSLSRGASDPQNQGVGFVVVVTCSSHGLKSSCTTFSVSSFASSSSVF